MTTKYQGTPEDVRALDAYIKLSRAAESVFDRINARLPEYDLTTTQFAALEALYHLGTLSQVVLAAKLLKSTGNITTVLQNLEKRGLIERERRPDDQRVVQVSISERGRALISAMFPAHVARVVEAFAVLTAEEQATLARLCRKLGTAQAAHREPARAEID
ncbi:MAG: MarR family transcriptional regulator [bacterium]|nr:MarR family transcriptional regulator [bacterium]